VAGLIALGQVTGLLALFMVREVSVAVGASASVALLAQLSCCSFGQNPELPLSSGEVWPS
jgi:hypothetical protein